MLCLSFHCLNLTLSSLSLDHSNSPSTHILARVHPWPRSIYLTSISMSPYLLFFLLLSPPLLFLSSHLSFLSLQIFSIFLSSFSLLKSCRFSPLHLLLLLLVPILHLFLSYYSSCPPFTHVLALISSSQVESL